jgi:hypothetical protein
MRRNPPAATGEKPALCKEKDARVRGGRPFLITLYNPEGIIAMETTSRTLVPANASSLLDMALSYATLGWPVFPCEPGGKWPLIRSPHPKGSAERSACGGRFRPGGCGRDGHGVKDASTDPEVIRAWWSRVPQANIGLSCGITFAGHGPDVVDFDVKDGARGAESFARLRDVGLLRGAFAMASTPSGGWHLYFEGSGQHNGVLRGYGVDFRSVDGYVLGVGSVTPKGVYRWIRIEGFPQATVKWPAIRDLIKPPPPARRARSLRRHDITLNGLTDFVRNQEATSGNRQSGLFWAALKALEDGHGDDALEELGAQARANGLPDGDVRKALGSARLRYGNAVRTSARARA